MNRGGRYIGEPPVGSVNAVSGSAPGILPYRSDSGAWGYRNLDGTVVVPPFLDAARPFKGGIGAVSLGGRWWYIAEPQR